MAVAVMMVSGMTASMTVAGSGVGLAGGGEVDRGESGDGEDGNGQQLADGASEHGGSPYGFQHLRFFATPREAREEGIVSVYSFTENRGTNPPRFLQDFFVAGRGVGGGGGFCVEVGPADW
jgi:hypothetical protein